MNKFIRNIGKCRFNGFGADLYSTKYGASIRFDRNCNNLPANKYLTFSSVDNAEEFIDKNEGSNGLNTLVNILDKASVS